MILPLGLEVFDAKKRAEVLDQKDAWAKALAEARTKLDALEKQHVGTFTWAVLSDAPPVLARYAGEELTPPPPPPAGPPPGVGPAMGDRGMGGGPAMGPAPMDGAPMDGAGMDGDKKGP